jgi:hypothetical protein
MNPLLEPDYSVPEQPAENPLLAAIKWKEFKAGLNALLQDPKRAAELGLVKSAVSGATLAGDVYAGREAMPLPTDMTQEQGMRVADMAGLAMTGGVAGTGQGGVALGSGPIKAYRAGDAKGRGGKTFYALEERGAEPYAKGSGQPIQQVDIDPKNLFDTSANIDHFRLYNQFLEETNNPAGRGKNGLPFWTAETDLKKWLDAKGIKPDAIKLDENTGVPSIAVYSGDK